MTIDPQAPADTRIMSIVHGALRRDLVRAREALAVDATLGAARRTAIGDQLLWLMQFLHEHHEGEDRGLWPRVRAANPEAGPLLDQMDRDHHAIAPGMNAVEQAAALLRLGGPAKPVIEAIDLLEATLLPHLKREELEVMPVVSASISQGEWDAYDEQENIGERSPARLAMIGHWLLDGLTSDQADQVTGLVPPVKRFLLVHGFGALYRWRARRCWGPLPTGFGVDRGRSFPLSTHGTVSVDLAADPEQIWTVLADPTRVGEWSHEAVGARWLDGADQAVAGAWFQGRSRSRIFGWRRDCVITTAQPNRQLTWRTRGGVGRDCTEWSYILEPTESGTRLTQNFTVVTCARWFATIIAITVPEHRGRADALTDDLRNLGAVAARSMPVPSTGAPRA